jgi:YtkA-like
MRSLWWLVIGGAVAVVGLGVVLGFAFFSGGDSGDSGVLTQECKPQEIGPSAGNANVEGQARGKGYARRLVVRATDKQSGAPVQGAKVTVRGEMDCPHFMPLYEKTLRETSPGTYKGDYQLIMQGHWTFKVVVRSEQGGSTTASFPLELKIPA